MTADLLNDRVLPFLSGMRSRSAGFSPIGDGVLRDTRPHEYDLYLALENIDHTRTKTKSPQTNGICHLAVRLAQGPLLPQDVANLLHR
jgi:hypothetical protein